MSPQLWLNRESRIWQCWGWAVALARIWKASGLEWSWSLHSKTSSINRCRYMKHTWHCFFSLSLFYILVFLPLFNLIIYFSLVYSWTHVGQWKNRRVQPAVCVVLRNGRIPVIGSQRGIQVRRRGRVDPVYHSVFVEHAAHRSPNLRRWREEDTRGLYNRRGCRDAEQDVQPRSVYMHAQILHRLWWLEVIYYLTCYPNSWITAIIS